MHAAVHTGSQFGVWRALLGFSEGANFPAVFKALAEWFPPEKRSFATGVVNAGVNLASVVGPPLFVALTSLYGWRSCFVGVSALGFVWVALWGWKYHNPEQRAAQVKPAAVPMKQVLQFRPTWGYVSLKVLVDPTWYFLLFWLPLYFRDVHQLEMSRISWALPLIYFMSGVGSIAGGWLSGRLLKSGWDLRRVRLGGLLVCASIMPFAIFNAMRGSAISSILIFCIAAVAHQAFSTIAFMLPADVFPSTAVGTVLGMGGFAGAMSSVLFSAVLPGYLVPVFGYPPLVFTLSFGYLAAVLVMWRTFGEFHPVAINSAKA